MIIVFDKIRQYVKNEEFKLSLFYNKVHVINYREMISLDKERISFLTDKFRLIIRGDNLVINKLLDNEVLILGVIYGIEVNYD